MNTKIIGIIVVLAIIVGGVYLLTQSNTQTSTNQNTSTQQTQPTVKPTEGIKTYTLDDIAKHSTASDCWATIDGKVYDLTTFIPNHPGGQVITEICGKDGSTQFKERPNTANSPHPPQAEEMLKKLYIGELK